MTDGHKHRIVRVRRKGLTYRLLRQPLWHTMDFERVDASPYPYGMCVKHDGFYLSLLGILHRWTGLTLEVTSE